ncbi:hypothetical protein SmJEL517_g00238 [Synchytrium microbalum]|uniref:FHA domain-containing protein n=1 Tax=Synchytrium microbalum TaxID=1806994 RepID=A0A507CIM3_9FUNG|nr:uncharacterized protein SmJEL517_g00238 [Synchytrium microbalum]TPX37994.1 hypothetical protein SmJEL517_g00238 [Synchytrium microbalum]
MTFKVPSLPPGRSPARSVPPAPPRADEIKEEAPNAPPLPYSAPEWSNIPTQGPYSLEARRLPICDIELEHASVSRYHAIIQFKGDGTVYLYDISVHGTFINKKQVPKQQYITIRNGDQIRFGQSTRLYVLNAPHDEEEEQQQQQALQLQHQQRVKRQLQQQQKQPEPEPDQEVSWGFQEDAYELESLADDTHINVDDISPDVYYARDPKKALVIWFETQSSEPTYEVSEEGGVSGQGRTYTARVTVPLDSGTTLTGLGKSTRKRDAERLAAFEACAKLDRAKLLRAEDRKAARKRVKEDEDDDDTYYDRTDRRDLKKRRGDDAGRAVETAESLFEKKRVALEEIETLEAQISIMGASQVSTSSNDDDDDMDAVLKQMQSKETVAQKEDEKRQLIERVSSLRKEVARLERIIKASKVSLEPPKAPTPTSSKSQQIPVLDSSKPKDMLPPPRKPSAKMEVEHPITETTVHQQQHASQPISEFKSESNDDVDMTPQSEQPVSQGRRRFGVMTREAVEAQKVYVEHEDVVDSVGKAGDEAMKEANAAYGY